MQVSEILKVKGNALFTIAPEGKLTEAVSVMASTGHGDPSAAVRALAGKRAWITGLRRGQSAGRGELPAQAFDPVHGIEKFNPLADWSEDEVWHYIRSYDVPYNALYNQGYRSIGCAPCSRPVAPWEDARAGRWWWESAESRECGLHEIGARVDASAGHLEVEPVAGAQDVATLAEATEAVAAKFKTVRLHVQTFAEVELLLGRPRNHRGR